MTVVLLLLIAIVAIVVSNIVFSQAIRRAIDADPTKGRNALNFTPAGILDLLEEGRFDEAVDVYSKFTGVDRFTAQEAIERLQHGGLTGAEWVEILDELRAGRKINALKLYRQISNVNLREAKETIDELEREQQAGRDPQRLTRINHRPAQNDPSIPEQYVGEPTQQRRNARM